MKLYDAKKPSVYPLLDHVIGVIIKVQDVSTLVRNFFICTSINETTQQETNIAALHFISDLYRLNCLLFLPVHFNRHKLELRQISHSKMITTHIMAFTGAVAFTVCDPGDLTIPSLLIILLNSCANRK
jgi:hypothetical protein